MQAEVVDRYYRKNEMSYLFWSICFIYENCVRNVPSAYFKLKEKKKTEFVLLPFMIEFELIDASVAVPWGKQQGQYKEGGDDQEEA